MQVTEALPVVFLWRLQGGGGRARAEEKGRAQREEK